jgi:hypothetical protein
MDVNPSLDVTAAAFSLLVDRTTAQISQAFAAAGIPLVLLKGPTFGWFWPPPQVRAYGDSDLLVPISRFEDAVDLLVDEGFRRRPGLGLTVHSWTFDRFTGHRQTVDLHRTIPGVGVPPEVLWDRLRPHTVEHQVDGVAVPGLDRTATTVHALLHAAPRGPDRDKNLLDVERLLRHHTTPWWEAAQLGRTLGADAVMRLGLQRVAGGAALADMLDLGEPSPFLRHLSDSRIPTKYLAKLRTVAPRDRPALVLRQLFPPPQALRADGPSFARRGRLGLSVAYVVRPFRLAARLLLAGAATAWFALRSRRTGAEA